MSTDHCEHGVIVSDTMGDYRCWECEPPSLEEFREMRRDRDESRERLETLTLDMEQLEQLRRERESVTLLIDKALEDGLAAGKCDTALLELAECLGFPRRAVDLMKVAQAGGAVIFGSRRFRIVEYSAGNDGYEMAGYEVPEIRLRGARTVRMVLRECA